MLLAGVETRLTASRAGCQRLGCHLCRFASRGAAEGIGRGRVVIANNSYRLPTSHFYLLTVTTPSPETDSCWLCPNLYWKLWLLLLQRKYFVYKYEVQGCTHFHRAFNFSETIVYYTRKNSKLRQSWQASLAAYLSGVFVEGPLLTFLCPLGGTVSRAKFFGCYREFSYRRFFSLNLSVNKVLYEATAALCRNTY